MDQVADAIREVTATMQRAIDGGQRSAAIDAHDLIDILLAIADEIDPPIPETVGTRYACPRCHERRADQLHMKEDDTALCATCGLTFVSR